MTEREPSAAFEAGQRDVLEHIAGGTPLPEILERIVLLIEAQSADMLCSILLLDTSGAEEARGQPPRLRHGAAPHLPRELITGIDGAVIGPLEGSCGAAAHGREAIVVEDIATHPNWNAYRHLALPHGLRACWSSPIFADKGGEVLGTFAMYHREKRAPNERERRWVARATHLAAIALSRDAALRSARAANARYRQIVDTAYEGVWLLDVDARTLFVNERTAQMLGHEARDLLGKPLVDFMDDASRAHVEDGLIHRMRTTTEQREARLRRHDGTIFWALLSGGPIRDETGHLVGALVMITDISELKSTEEALRQSEAGFRMVFENAALGMALVDAEGRTMRSNPALRRLLGRTEDELRGLGLTEVVHEDDLGAAVDVHRALVSGARDTYQMESRYTRKNGGVVWCRVTASLVRGTDGGPRHAIALFEDVTDRRHMEEAVRTSERLRTLMYGAVTDVLFYIGVEPGPRFRFLSVNPAFLQATGLREDQIIGHFADEVIPPSSRELVLANYVRAVRERRVIVWDEVSRYPAGVRHGEVSVTPLFDDAGHCTNLLGTVHDVTERHRAQRRLEEQAALLDKTSDAILVCHLDGEIQHWNKSAERLYGWTAAEAIGRRMDELQGSDGTPSLGHAMSATRAAGEWSGDLHQHKKSGHPVTVEGRWTLLRDEAGAARRVLAVHTDVTDRRRLEARIGRAKRLESLGLLAGGIAHDFNNILVAILGNVSLARELVGTSHAAAESLAEVEEAGARATALVRQILTFSRQQEPKREVLALEPVVREALRLLTVTKPETVRLAVEIPKDLPPVFADPTQVHQVAMNLGVNAIQAMAPSGGTLRVTAAAHVAEAPFEVGATELPPGRYVRFVVADTGVGMNEATVERVFDPFFSTKPAGDGTGLGLSVVHGIVENHNGGIAVRSAPGRGTEISVYWPAVANR